MTGLLQQFGEIDIYLFDQLLRGRIAPGMRVIDAGCGGGRNLLYLLSHGYDVAGCDRDHTAVEAVRAIASRLAPQLPGGNFRVEPIEAMSFPDACADVVLASAVLHFASDDEQFDAMIRELWRVLKPAACYFTRLASSSASRAGPSCARPQASPATAVNATVDGDFWRSHRPPRRGVAGSIQDDDRSGPRP